MDDMLYEYYPQTNRLRRVTDAVADANYDVDIDSQTDADNYLYDPSGNLIMDKAEGITIAWNVAGKVKKITKTDSEIDFYYDAMGNRIGKKVTDSESNITATWYVLDAQGNQMATYEHQTDAEENETLKLNEWVMYGSSRLGVLRANKVLDENATTTTFAYGRKHYELSNHLGNVLSTVSDAKLAVDEDDDGLTDYFEAVVKTQQDYYPFGMLMPERQYADENLDYRYGFNGQEKDDQVKGKGNSYDFGARMYDSRIGRFQTLDPLKSKFPSESNYIFAGNCPIVFIDVNGEYKYPKNKESLYRKEFPMLTLYLEKYISEDVKKSTLLQNAIVRHADNPDFGNNELFNKILVWGKESITEIDFITDLHGNANTLSVNTVVINWYYAKAIEGILSNPDASEEDKLSAITAFYITMMDETTLVGHKYRKDPLVKAGGTDGDPGNLVVDEVFYQKNGYNQVNRIYAADKDNLGDTKEVINTIRSENRDEVLPTIPEQ